MLISDWLKNLPRRRVRCSRRKGWQKKPAGPADLARRLDQLEDRTLLAVDFGDAPDTGAGTGTGNYNTLATDNGPSHTIVAGLFLGNGVDGDSGTLQNVAANADDQFTTGGSDDEDGVLSPLDLLGTIGAAPTVTLLVTNTTGSAAMLSGWIDYNQNGAFEHATERVQIAVPDNTTNGRFSLRFPAVPLDATGTTYARFRLSTDIAAENSTGAAGDGEVEDYVFRIYAPTDGIVESSVKIASGTNGGPALANSNRFGTSVAGLGDLDGDGIVDIAVAAPGGGGAIHIQTLRVDGTVKNSTKISGGLNGGPSNTTFFGSSVASLGDLDGDGVVDLAVGDYLDDTGGVDRGSVYVVFLNSNGTARTTTKIASSIGGGPTLGNLHSFGRSVTSLGDLDGDGVVDLAVGATRDSTGGGYRGSVHVLLMNVDGTVKSSSKIASGVGGGPTLANFGRFGSAVATLGDLDGDGVVDLAVGASQDETGGPSRGAVYVLFLNADGTVKNSTKIASDTNGAPALADFNGFGDSVAAIGDVDGDGVLDVAVGAPGDSMEGSSRGAIYFLLLNPNGSVKGITKIPSTSSGGPSLSNSDFFGISVGSLGDLNGDGVLDVAVGASGDDTGGSSRGAVHIMIMNSPVILDVGIVDTTLNDAAPGSLVTFAFSEDVSGFTVDDIAPDNGTLSDFSGSGRNYTVTFTANDDVTGVGSVSVAEGSYTDLVGNAGVAGSDTVVIDRRNPTVVVDVVASLLNDSAPASRVKFTFSESVTDFIVQDVTVSGGTLSDFAGSGGTFEVTLNANDDFDGTATVTVVSGSYVDRSGNAGSSDSDSVAVDTRNPSVVVNIVDPLLNDADRSSLVTFEFSEDVTGFDESDVGTTIGNLRNFTVIDSNSFTAEFIVLDQFTGGGSVTVIANSYTDAVGNNGTAGTATVDIDVRVSTRDFGDASDTAAGTGTGNYQTTLGDGGPRHLVVSGLHLGAGVDVDDGTLQNVDADADDRSIAMVGDDEDGVVNPSDLVWTEGAVPKVTLIATNVTGSTATLSGWIDYNGDGVFTNATERAQVAVPAATTDGRFTLTFPAIPVGASGRTYARFRLSTDAASSNSTGAAGDGEVEDYVFTISAAAEQPVTIDRNRSRSGAITYAVAAVIAGDGGSREGAG